MQTESTPTAPSASEPLEVQRANSRAPVIRGTQSFLTTLSDCWRSPSLVGLEIAWRWGIGIPTLGLVGWEIYRILASVSLASTGIDRFSLVDTVVAAQVISAVVDVLLPRVEQVARWLAPLLVLAWAVASGLGRSLVLRKYDPDLRSAPWLLVRMQLLRIVMLGASFAVWFLMLRWAAWSSLGGSDPDLVAYFIQAIFLSLGMFCFWAAVSWVFSIAPLLAILEGKGMAASLRASLRFGSGSLRGLRAKLVEINLVLGIVKLALIVLAMVFCATPVPFKEQINGMALYGWWAVVTVWYLAASDFFQVARVIGFIQIWRMGNEPRPA